MDTLVQKARELYQHTARFPIETILTATVWLEEKHCKTPNGKIAMAIALHYLILALRHDAGRDPPLRRNTARAPHAGKRKHVTRAPSPRHQRQRRKPDKDSNRSRR